MILREAKEGEVPPGTFKPDWVGVLEEDGKVTGYACASKIDGAAWVHELFCISKNPRAAVLLTQAAATVCRNWGFKEVLVNVANDRLQEILKRRGFVVTQTIMKGAI